MVSQLELAPPAVSDSLLSKKFRFLMNCSNLMGRTDCIRRWRVHVDNIVSFLHGVSDLDLSRSRAEFKANETVIAHAQPTFL